MIVDDGLRQAVGLIPEWLRRQHWFKGARSGPVEVRPVSATLLADGSPRLWYLLVEVSHAEGNDIYQIPLSIRTEWADRLDHVRLGETSEGHVYDALHDKDATAILLDYFADGPRPVEDLSFHVQPGVTLPVGQPSLVTPGEHRNTSLAYGDAAILKVFRHITPGINPDVETHEALTKAGCTLVAPLLGWIDGAWKDESGTARSASLAMLRGFLTTATDGWALATTSVRDLFAEGDLRADEVGGDFAAEAYRLGMATARVHETMAEVMPTGTFTHDDLTALADSMDQRLSDALDVVPELEPYADGLRSRYQALRERTDPTPVQRVHGSYHLGQVLRTVVGWKLADFEGETMTPPERRRDLHSPLRDVAQMLRSFDYAARHLLVTDHPPQDPSYEQISYRAQEWVERNSTAFCKGYAAASQVTPGDDEELIRAYEADKAVYETVYEARHRPSWLPIPLAGVERLTADS